MASDIASLKAATESILGEVQKQAELLAKGLQSLAPPQDSNSPSAQYLLETSIQIGEIKKKMAGIDDEDPDAIAKPTINQ